MTEADWLKAKDPEAMLRLVEARFTPRRWHLLACAHARRASRCSRTRRYRSPSSGPSGTPARPTPSPTSNRSCPRRLRRRPRRPAQSAATIVLAASTGHQAGLVRPVRERADRHPSLPLFQALVLLMYLVRLRIANTATLGHIDLHACT